MITKFPGAGSSIGPALPPQTKAAAGPAQLAALGATQPKRPPGTNKEGKYVRRAAGKIWVDPTLDEWPREDFRIFCGDLGNEVTDDLLANAFRKFSSFQKAKVVRDRRTGKTRGQVLIARACATLVVGMGLCRSPLLRT
mmetsp:Transcript_27908/g.63474  ORF Transcript_27908/g.63474 Transcript_27908/m.63474 type:complete len:139 (+) Transcript_27908:1640-2056(+)